MLDPNETWLEKWLLSEANEVYNYYSCMVAETNPRVKAIWERFLDYELGHLHMVSELFKKYERRDPAEILPASLPDPIAYQSQREFVRGVLSNERDMRKHGTRFVPLNEESPASLRQREQLNSQGSPSNAVAANYEWRPGTELARNFKTA